MQTAVEQSAWLSALCQQAGPSVPQQLWLQQQQYQHPATAAGLMSTDLLAGSMSAPLDSAGLHAGAPAVQAACAVPANQATTGMPGQTMPGHPPGQQPIPRNGSLVNLLQEILADEDTDGLLMDITRATAVSAVQRPQQPMLQHHHLHLGRNCQAVRPRADLQPRGTDQQAMLQQPSSLCATGGTKRSSQQQQSAVKPPGHEDSQQLQDWHRLIHQHEAPLNQQMQSNTAGTPPLVTTQNEAGGVAAGVWTGSQGLELDADVSFLEMLRGDGSGVTDPSLWLENVSRLCQLPGVPQDAWQQPDQQQQQQETAKPSLVPPPPQQLTIQQPEVVPEGPGSGHANNGEIGVGCFYGNGGDGQSTAADPAAGNNAAASCGDDGGNDQWFNDAWSHAISTAGAATSPDFSSTGARSLLETPAAARLAALTTAASGTAGDLKACSPGVARAAGVYQGCSGALSPPAAAAAAAGMAATGADQCNMLEQLQILSEATETGPTAEPVSVGGCVEGVTQSPFVVAAQQNYNALGMPTANNTHVPQQQQQQVGWYADHMPMDMADASSGRSPGQGSKFSAGKDQRGAESAAEAEQSAASGSPAGKRLSVRVAQKRQQAAQETQHHQGQKVAASCQQQQQHGSRGAGADSAAGGVEQQQQQMFRDAATASGISTLGLSALALSQPQQQQQQDGSMLADGDMMSSMASQAFVSPPGSSLTLYQNTLESGMQQQQQEGLARQPVAAIPKEQVQMMLANLQPAALAQLVELQQTQPVLARVVMRRVLQQLQQQQQSASVRSGFGLDHCQSGVATSAAQINTGQHYLAGICTGNGRVSDPADVASFSAGALAQQQQRHPLMFSRHRRARSLQPSDGKLMALNSRSNGRASSCEVRMGWDQQQQQQAAMVSAAAGLEGMQGAEGGFADVDMMAAGVGNEPRQWLPGAAAAGSAPPAAAAAASYVSVNDIGAGSKSRRDNTSANGDHMAHDKPPKSRKEPKSLSSSKRLRQVTQNDMSDAVTMPAASVVRTEKGPDTAGLGPEQQAAADQAMAAAAAAPEMSMGTSAITGSCSAPTWDACDPAVIMQQARALVRILTRLDITQLMQARSMLSSVLERSARGLVNHMPAIERMVNQLICMKAQSSNGGGTNGAESASKQQPVTAATPPPNMPDAALPSILARMQHLPPQGYSAAAASQGMGLMGQQQQEMDSTFTQQQQQYQQLQQQMQHLQYCVDSQMQQHALQMQQQQQQRNGCTDPEQTSYGGTTRWQSGRRIKRRSECLPAQDAAAAAAAGMLERAGSAPGPVGSSCSGVQQQQQQSLQSNSCYQQQTSPASRQQQQQLALQMIQQQQQLQRQQQQLAQLQQSILGTNPGAAVAADDDLGVDDRPAASAAAVTSSLNGIQQQQQDALLSASGWSQPMHTNNRMIFF